MDALKENLAELEIGSTVESIQRFIDIQRELFHSQIDQLQNVVVTQCKLTGVNPLAQEMAAGALSIKIGKRPRDLLNPKAVKYMQAVFSIKDAITKKESREISAQFGVTATQVRDFFNSQRTRVRKQVRLSREKALRSNVCKETKEGALPTGSEAVIPVEPVPLNSVGPVNSEEAPSCSTQDDSLTGIDELDKHFVENIFSKMQKEETFSGQVKLMEWILQIQNTSVLYWFLSKGGVMILATWLSQAAVEEQTTVVLIILKVLSHLPLQKALPEHMSAILQSVNKLRLYRFSDVSNRARLLISRWSKMFARSQVAKKPNGLRSSTETQNEMLLKQSISEIMGDSSWQSNVYNAEGVLAISNVRKLESPQVLKQLPASTDDSEKKNHIGVSGSHSRERRKVQLVEQPGQKVASKNSQTTRTVPVSQSRPLSADDIQKAKMRALYMQQGKHGKTGSSSNGMNEVKSEGLNKPSPSKTSFSRPVSKAPSQPPEEQKKPVILSPKTSNRLETTFDPKQPVVSKESPWERCQKVKIPWHIPPEIIINQLWSVGTGESSKEVDMEKNRNRRERETFYYTNQDIPSNPKEPWDREMDHDDTLTPEIPTEQPPDTDSTETQVTHGEHVNAAAATLEPSSSQISGAVAAEPDLELLAVLLKNPSLVFALTSGQAGNMTSEETVKLLDMIKAGGDDTGKKVEEKVEVSLPSPTPSGNPGMSGWRPEAVRNPFSQHSQVGNRVAQASVGVGTTIPVAERLPAASMVAPQQEANGRSLAQQLSAAMARLLPQTNTTTPEKLHSPNVAFSHHGLSSNSPVMQSPTGPSMRVETMAQHIPEKVHSSYSPSPLMPTLSQRQTPQQLQPQPHHAYDPLQTHPYLTRPPVGNIGPMSDPWRGRQSLDSNLHSQVNQNNYNASSSFGGSMQPQLRSGRPPREGNEYASNDGFESWSPENSPNRPSEFVEGRNYMEPGMNSGRSYRADRTSWQGHSSGYKDQNRQGNRWRDRR
ncbi:luminidependens [Hibiscus trionum]|uniref:Luminidependens n=1 Tax=Hibiscus trionum TaxID=183268 RepID=A0A9W7HA58_HIBTR|nr:luminidependens [Hibiscus trionum]